ncbi:MAG: transglutaminase domain-containing protein, partial [Clostridiales bacterium]|nr:transglutaminase domain-containing protein [Clostridiales bacterium]
ILYRRTKKLYRGKNMKTLEAFEQYIEDKITYHLPNPDMYKNMRYGTCVSYATMLKAMCDMSGIPCRIYAGWATPWDGHCWNRVKVKSRWFWADLCWDDNTIYGDTSYLHQRKLWEDHWEYKPVRIYRPSLPY